MTEPRYSSSFPKSFFRLFEIACEKQVVLEFESEKQAVAMRAKLYKFRLRLRNELNALSVKADNVELLVRGFTLIAQPSGSSLDQAMEKAGVSPSTDTELEELDKRLDKIISERDKSS